MNLKTTALLSLAVAATTTTEAFSVATPTVNGRLPYYAKVVTEPSSTQSSSQSQENMAASPLQSTSSSPAAPTAKKPIAKKKNDTSKAGLFAPLVLFAKKVLGESRLNKIRGKVIGKHSQVIGDFVATHETAFGARALETLFQIADQDGNGVLSKEELTRTLTNTLGFVHLNEKQLQGIFDKADQDGNGHLDYEEFRASMPSTLKTNLTKLAKHNGHRLGFLA